MTRGPLLVTGVSNSCEILAVSSSQLPNLVEAIRCGPSDVGRGLPFTGTWLDSVIDL